MQEPYRRTEHLYFLPVGGTAMASLAGLLAAAGHRVEGVDSVLYPPMSTLLEELAIPVRLGFDPRLIPVELDRVIIGNAVPRSNPEVEEVLSRRLPFLSQAEAVAHYLLGEGRRSLVVAGTHGKTTTASLLSWLLEAVGEDPSYLVGGLLPWSGRSFRLGRSPWMVIEGDEYNTAFFDRGPKFLHYRPWVFLLGPVEFDHADIFRDLDAVLTAFRAGTAQVPKDGAVVASSWCELSLAVAATAASRVVTVGPRPDDDLQVVDLRHRPRGMDADVRWRGRRLTLEVPLYGRHNLQNAAMALAAALEIGVPPGGALEALASFPGVHRRMEVLGEVGGIMVVDDFAHHPTAVAATVGAGRERWPKRRLVVAYEPRSLTAGRSQFQEAYAQALALADLVLVVAPFHLKRLAEVGALDRSALARELEGRGVESIMPPEGADPVEALLPHLQGGDVVLGCSSGDFGDFHRRLLAALAERLPK